jgi:hypothetical protein
MARPALDAPAGRLALGAPAAAQPFRRGFLYGTGPGRRGTGDLGIAC